MDGWWKGKWGKEKKLSFIQMALVFFLLVGFLVLSGGKKDATVVIQEPTQREDTPISEGEDSTPTDRSIEEETTLEPLEIFVHVSGQVQKPGVVCLPSGARVYEAVEKAGGMTDDGDLESVNLAAVLVDQQKVVVGSLRERLEQAAAGNSSLFPTQDPSETTQETGVNSGKININTATQEQLETLPGIGPVIAQNIINYRQQQGIFKSIEDIKNVNRIGEATFANIRDLIGVR